MSRSSHEKNTVGRALIVDDEVDNRFVIGALMKSRLCCDVVPVDSAAEALTRFDSEHFDVIVSDYQMPRMTGLDFAHELNKRKCETPLFIYTACDISKLDLQKLHLVTEVVLKPNLDDLFLAISKLLKRPLKPGPSITR